MDSVVKEARERIGGYCMNKTIVWIIALLLLSIAVTAAKKEVTLNIGESFTIEDRNITLVAGNRDAFIVCMNGHKIVIEDNKNYDGVLFDVSRKWINAAKFEVYVPTNDNECLECSNQKCVESFNAECRENRDCDGGKCSIGRCENGKCAYSVDEECRNAEDIASTTTTTMTITTTTIESKDNSANKDGAGNANGDEITGNAIGDSGKQLKRATFILLGFLAIVAITSVFIERRRRRGNDKKEDTGQIYY